MVSNLTQNKIKILSMAHQILQNHTHCYLSDLVPHSLKTILQPHWPHSASSYFPWALCTHASYPPPATHIHRDWMIIFSSAPISPYQSGLPDLFKSNVLMPLCCLIFLHPSSSVFLFTTCSLSFLLPLESKFYTMERVGCFVTAASLHPRTASATS